ncbi:hypothetical protein [Halovibrio variabilis]|uniref:hypothetical protein n=1 Tax=Halovibrio variabilis TaxID=31910 RepID=UPI001FE48BBD|nr:hypothetical protein [Halovibrio variabilis]
MNELIYSVIPNLNSAEKLVITTLEGMAEAATTPLDILKLTDKRKTFELEIHRIRLNLEHLLNRYRSDVDAILHAEGEHQGPQVVPDAQEADAIRNAVDIYQQVRAFQRGERRHPISGR